MSRLAWLTPVVFVAVMLGGVGIAQLTGSWVTSGRAVVATGQLSVDDVKGSMSLQTAADGLAMPYEDLVTLVGPADRTVLTPATLFKDLEALVPGFELSAFRETLRAYLADRTNGSTQTPTLTPSPTTTASPVASATPTHTGTPTGTGTGRRSR